MITFVYLVLEQFLEVFKTSKTLSELCQVVKILNIVDIDLIEINSKLL